VSTLRPPRARTWELDEACAAAVDLARAAAEDAAGPGQVGEHLDARAEGDRVVTHLFRCTDPGYVGWHWAVTVARASRAKVVTVSESVLLPGPDSLLAPEWVPWSDRVLPGDVGVGDLLPAQPEDDRLAPAVGLEGDTGVLSWEEGEPWRAWAAWDTWTTGETEGPEADTEGDTGPDAASDTASDTGPDTGAGPAELPTVTRDEGSVGRSRVLSAIGRDETALRWYSGEHGPRSPLAHAAPGPCMTCGFLVRLGDPLGRVFGVCANEYAPDDGRIVSGDHGCGAHSESTLIETQGAAVAPVIDEFGYDLVDLPGVALDDTVFESFSGGS
jgi:Protein of unknown function (DUF3027)